MSYVIEKRKDYDLRGFDYVDTDVVKEVNMDKRLLTIIGSTETVDRMGDIIRVNGWDLSNYLKNPVFLWAHMHSLIPIGAALRVVKKRSPLKMLLFTIKFPTEGLYPLADSVLAMYNEKILNTSSVGFRPIEYKELQDGEGNFTGIDFIRQELYELSAVSVPANPDATQLDNLSGIKKAIILGEITDEMQTDWEDDLREEIENVKVVYEEDKVTVSVPEDIKEEKKPLGFKADKNGFKNIYFEEHGKDEIIKNELGEEEEEMYMEDTLLTILQKVETIEEYMEHVCDLVMAIEGQMGLAEEQGRAVPFEDIVPQQNAMGDTGEDVFETILSESEEASEEEEKKKSIEAIKKALEDLREKL